MSQIDKNNESECLLPPPLFARMRATASGRNSASDPEGNSIRLAALLPLPLLLILSLPLALPPSLLLPPVKPNNNCNLVRKLSYAECMTVEMHSSAYFSSDCLSGSFAYSDRTSSYNFFLTCSASL